MSYLLTVVEEVKRERERQLQWSDGFDRGNSRNDWIAYIASYSGDAADKVIKKEKGTSFEDNMRFRSNMIKVAALAIAAVESLDKGYMDDEHND